MEIDAYQRLLALQDKQKTRKKPSHLESTLQQHCMRWFRNTFTPARQRKLFFSIPNGAHVTKTHARILKAEGLTEGVADTMLAISTPLHHGLYIEFKKMTQEYDETTGKMKTIKTYQRQEQKEWQKIVEEQGYRYEVVRTFEEFKNIIEDYLHERDQEHKDCIRCEDNDSARPNKIQRKSLSDSRHKAD